MVNRLRAKFICVIMVLMAVLLLTIMSLICHFAWHNMEEESDQALQSATFEPWTPGGMGPDSPNPNYPCFILCRDPFGNLNAVGHAYYDLSNTEMLSDILQEAKATGKESGFLQDRQLKFQKIQLWKMEEYVFTDVSAQIRTMRNLYLSCVMIFVVAMAVFFLISWLLSKWMVRPVEQAWKQQRQFVADASHELKTPLTVITTNAELLHSGEYDEAANRRFTGGIVTMASQMRGLVEGMLELAKVDDGQLKGQIHGCLDFSDLTEECVMGFEPVYFESDRVLEATVQPGIHVRGSRQHLQQVVYILLDNAKKYSDPGSQVTMVLEQSRSHCTLRVSSRGAALTSQQCEDIFKRFYRVDEARSMNRSYGLGLPIAEAIVREHRGKIGAQSKDGINTFFVTLPTCDPGK